MMTELTYTPTYDRSKMEQLALYVAWRSTGDRKFGKTKLAKILFYSDFISYRESGQAITGAEYSKLPNGPFPLALNSALKRLQKGGKAVAAANDYHGYSQERLVSTAKPDISGFSPDEISIVEQVMEALREEDAAGVSALSHREAAWTAVSDMERIPYELAWVAPCPSEEALAVGQDVAKRARNADRWMRFVGVQRPNHSTTNCGVRFPESSSQ